ncbi:MAG: prolyl oligopeptidase family serine peptidase [Candidatus Sericytochromatia bacterium]
MKYKNLIGILLLGTILVGNMPSNAKEKIVYPQSKKIDVKENYHGNIIHDPYRWLEDPHSEDTKKWVDEQNLVTRKYIDSSSIKDKFKSRLTELWNYPKYSAPTKEGDRYFFYKNDGLQNQAVLYMQKELNGESKEILDPNKLSSDGTAAISSQSFNKEGTLLGYGISQSGSDRQVVKIRNVDTGKDYDEVLKWCKFSGIAWKNDSSGFYYNRFPETGTVPTEDLNNYSKIYWHTLGTAQSEDKLIYEDKKHKELGFYPFISDDGKYLFIHVYKGTASENTLMYREIESDGAFKKIISEPDASYEYIDNDNNFIYLKTTYNSPKGRIIKIDLNNPSKENWQEIIPEQLDVMDSVKFIGGKFVITYMKNAYHTLKTYELDGKLNEIIKLPTIGSVEEITGKRDENEMFIKFTSFTYPSTILKYDINKNKLETFRDSEAKFNPKDYETNQVFYKSKDGTLVSMFISHKKGLKLDGNNPVLLYGYGGFNVSLNPSFSISRVVWMENGGVFAMPNLRGGGEYGEEWHKSGMLEKKQNVFDDFISAGEWLIENKYTNSKKLAIHGGSNGGLLVGASMTQRPDLFGAVICSVPVLDMLRYHKFTVGRYWIPEYGDAETNPEHFKFMIKYSPLHNIKKGINYPTTLVTTADTDDRVVPSHAHKFTATLQEFQKEDGNPILIRVETKAGHGAGKPTSKVIDEQTDIYSFLYKALEL